MNDELSPDDLDRLRRFTDLAEALEALARPVEFGLAVDEADRRALHRLRYRVAVEEGWIASEAVPDGEERDHFDDRALHVVGRDGDVVVATARLVLPQPGGPLPTEEEYGITVEPRGRVVDVGRGVVDAAYRDHDHRVHFGLLARCWRELASRGHRYMCGCSAEWLIDLYRSVGFVAVVLGPARRVWGVDRLPFLVDALASADPVTEHLGTHPSAGEPP